MGDKADLNGKPLEEKTKGEAEQMKDGEKETEEVKEKKDEADDKTNASKEQEDIQTPKKENAAEAAKALASSPQAKASPNSSGKVKSGGLQYPISLKRIERVMLYGGVYFVSVLKIL